VRREPGVTWRGHLVLLGRPCLGPFPSSVLPGIFAARVDPIHPGASALAVPCPAPGAPGLAWVGRVAWPDAVACRQREEGMRSSS
jgi:hypothetical protein